jgi:hypothetical protein
MEIPVLLLNPEVMALSIEPILFPWTKMAHKAPYTATQIREGIAGTFFTARIIVIIGISKRIG